MQIYRLGYKTEKTKKHSTLQNKRTGTKTYTKTQLEPLLDRPRPLGNRSLLCPSGKSENQKSKKQNKKIRKSGIQGLEIKEFRKPRLRKSETQKSKLPNYITPYMQTFKVMGSQEFI